MTQKQMLQTQSIPCETRVETCEVCSINCVVPPLAGVPSLPLVLIRESE